MKKTASFKLVAAAAVVLGIVAAPLTANAYPAGNSMAVTLTKSSVVKNARSQARAINVGPLCFVKFYQNKTNTLSGATYLSQQQANGSGTTAYAQLRTNRAGTYFVIAKVYGSCQSMAGELTQASTSFTVTSR